MSEKHLNNTEKAIAYIAKHPGCRSPEISEAIGVPTSNVTAILSAPVQAGYVVACKVESPGKPPMNEYRISATVAEDKVSWAEFRVAKRAKLPLTLATPKPMRTAPAAPTKAETPATPSAAPEPSEPPATAAWPADSLQGAAKALARVYAAPSPVVPEPIAKSPASTSPRFLIDHSGELRIELPDGDQLFVPRKETRALGILMKATEALWQTP